ncbi:TPA: hypothetical protein EYP26_00815 [Candidatus Bathyarchaeota archaeon]|nr:hypothetical protein [Candidatus Bathyarchaeota archaeon]
MEGVIKKAVEEYNRYRSPGATASFIGFEGERFLVEFPGAFPLFLRRLRLLRGPNLRVEALGAGQV